MKSLAFGISVCSNWMMYSYVVAAASSDLGDLGSKGHPLLPKRRSVLSTQAGGDVQMVELDYRYAP